MRFSRAGRFLVFFACGWLAGCAAPDVRYKDLLAPLGRMGAPAHRLEEFPVFLVGSGTKSPVPGAKLIIDSSPEPMVLESDGAGQVMMPVDAALLRRNPPVRVEPDGVTLVMRYSGKFSGNRIRSVQIRSASGLAMAGDSRVAVFHEDGDEALAREVLAALMRSRDAVKSVLGLEPKRWAVILEPGAMEKNVLYLTVPAAGYESAWSCFREDWESGDFMDVNPHEWAESTLVSALELYFDPRNRFIGDGLAELVVWKVNGLPEDYAGRLSRGELGNRETVDLLSAFQAVPGRYLHRRGLQRGIAKHGFSPGYALSFAFWHELQEKHGPSITSAFVREMARRPSPSAEDAIAVLVQLTGDPGIGNRIRFADVEAARSRIQGLAASP